MEPTPMAKWYVLRDGKKDGPFESEELARLAATGGLRPTDEVWRAGLSNWVQASEVKGVCWGSTMQRTQMERPDARRCSASPAQAPEEVPQSQDVQQLLIPCRVCAKSIAASAATCPGCGAPNDWLHPEIRRFSLALQEANFLPAQSRVGWKGFRIWGWGVASNEKHPANRGPKIMAAGALLGCIPLVEFIGGVVTGGLRHSACVALAFWAAIIIVVWGLVEAIVHIGRDAAAGQQVRFELDFSETPPAWTCNDERYWSAVRTFFRV